ncbi:hypothetical protein KY092_20305 [Natronomonas gomsonensis]|uniref:hypothetical protein n=1 Tax=Natronomonas gomsonensis TaxID=1046043 RepID=UPI00227AF8B1|nr:hypothetical protein [Natronomonas gomsonensis]MCY4732877.1 hypothetical protein [Natronomonas gomsonensis]
MSGRERVNLGGVWNGLSYVMVGVLSIAVFTFYGDSVDVVGNLVGLVFVGIGIVAVLAAKVPPLFTDPNRYWTGLFWTICGLGILGLSFLGSHRLIRGLLLGGAFVMYGGLVALNR